MSESIFDDRPGRGRLAGDGHEKRYVIGVAHDKISDAGELSALE